MKKILYAITILLSGVLLIGNANAQVKETSLQEAVNEEISYFGNADNFNDEQTFNAYQTYVNKMKNSDISNYALSDDKVNVYIFRGSTCWHCLDEISWLTTQVAEYGKYFNVHTYEVWSNKDNSKLMNTVAKTLGESASGVPYTVIGKKTYSGFSETMGQEMINEIKSQYETTDRYDVKNYVDMSTGTVIKEEKKSSAVIYVLLGIVLVAGIGVVIYMGKSK